MVSHLNLTFGDFLKEQPGNQPRFETALIEENKTKCRIVCIPRFSETGQLVLFNTLTLAVKVVALDGEGMGSEALESRECGPNL